MQMEVCPRCQTRHFVGTPCRCGLPASLPPRPIPTQPPRPRAGAAGKRVSSLWGLLVLVVSILLIGGIVYGISDGRAKYASADPSRKGETSAEYAEALTDPESSQALLNLIDSRSGYDHYRVFFLDPFGQVSSLGYEFSTDTVFYYYVLVDKPQLLTWEGHGLDRLKREAAGGTLDD
jgi:hypothetical protein